MLIQLIRSATLRLTMANTSFVIDPWLAAKGDGRSYAGEVRSPLVDLPMSPAAAVQGVDAAIVSHLHSDHLDDVAIAALGTAIPVITSDRHVEDLRGLGFRDVIGIQKHIRFGPVEIKATQGRHGPDELLSKMGPVSGFLFRAAQEPVLYWAGDTILCDEVREVIETDQPSVIVVHGCGATWSGLGPLVMDVPMILEAAQLAREAKVIVTHMDAVDHATVSRRDLHKALTATSNAASNVYVPIDGETMHFEIPEIRRGAAPVRGGRR